jgi:hypothetical protein
VAELIEVLDLRRHPALTPQVKIRATGTVQEVDWVPTILIDEVTHILSSPIVRSPQGRTWMVRDGTCWSAICSSDLP